VWGLNGRKAFAVGIGGDILHFDGFTWTVMSSPTAERLLGVWGTDFDDVWAVGELGTIVHYSR